MSNGLPEAWVERIFARMRATYGASFDRQWNAPEGTDAAEHARLMSLTWGRELAYFAAHSDALRLAMERLPEFPPNLVQFKALCRDCLPREEAAPALPAPRGRDPAPPAIMEALKAVWFAPDPKGCARQLRDRHLAGERLTRFQINFYRTALAGEDVNPMSALDEIANVHDRQQAARRRVEEYAAGKGLKI